MVNLSEVILAFLLDLVVLITDIFIFCSISGVYKKSDSKRAIYVISFFVLLLAIFSPTRRFMNFIVTLVEIALIYIYFVYIKKKDKKIVWSSCIIFGLVDMTLLTSEIAIEVLFPSLAKTNGSYILDIFINLISMVLIYKYKIKIRNALSNKNGFILVGVLTYIYITEYAINYLIFADNIPKEVVVISLGLLVFQTIFAILLYTGVVRIQKEIQTEQQQKRMETENKQLKEYSDYLDKNEDELRRFKHDYQNILNSLRISAEKGDTNAVVKQLSEYTNTQFDEKALRKYKGVNHIHVEELKSIAIAKLAKLYNEKINYSFGCEVEIYHVPKSVNILDLVRIIGITFDNAIEESKNLIAQSGDRNDAKVDAMYYQEDGNFEFKIRNRIKQNIQIPSDALSEERYTTKRHHAGIGLANVKQIETKYEQSMLINYGVENGWFVFDLEIMPDNEEEY